MNNDNRLRRAARLLALHSSYGARGMAAATKAAHEDKLSKEIQAEANVEQYTAVRTVDLEVLKYERDDSLRKRKSKRINRQQKRRGF